MVFPKNFFLLINKNQKEKPTKRQFEPNANQTKLAEHQFLKILKRIYQKNKKLNKEKRLGLVLNKILLEQKLELKKLKNSKLIHIKKWDENIDLIKILLA